MMPASLAACSGSPFFTAPAMTRRRASADIEIDPLATASRAVTGFSPTSTIFTRPRASMCVRRRALRSFGESFALAFGVWPLALAFGLRPLTFALRGVGGRFALAFCLRPLAFGIDTLLKSLLFVRVPLREIERQALERDRQIDALQLHGRRDFQAA